MKQMSLMPAYAAMSRAGAGTTARLRTGAAGVGPVGAAPIGLFGAPRTLAPVSSEHGTSVSFAGRTSADLRDDAMGLPPRAPV